MKSDPRGALAAVFALAFLWLAGAPGAAAQAEETAKRPYLTLLYFEDAELTDAFPPSAEYVFELRTDSAAFVPEWTEGNRFLLLRKPDADSFRVYLKFDGRELLSPRFSTSLLDRDLELNLGYISKTGRLKRGLRRLRKSGAYFDDHLFLQHMFVDGGMPARKLKFFRHVPEGGAAYWRSR